MALGKAYKSRTGCTLSSRTTEHSIREYLRKGHKISKNPNTHTHGDRKEVLSVKNPPLR